MKLRSTMVALALVFFAAAPASALAPPPAGTDTDGDGIPDAADACPDESGPKNSDAKKSGCPTDSIKTVVIRGTVVKLLEKIQFDVGKPTIKSSSDALLDDLASVMKTRGANVDLFEIAVHSDSLGSEKMNLALTEQRAKSIVDALVSRGIATARVRAMGYGEYCPIDSATTPEARANNRRVEVLVLKRGGKKTAAVAGCDAAVAKGIVPPSVP